MGMTRFVPSTLLAAFLATACGGVSLDMDGNPALRQVDDNAGPAREYVSIQAAVNDARPGDTVLVHDGNYRGFTVYASGKASSPITIRAAGTAAVIDRPNGNGEGITLNDASHIAIEGFTIIGMPRAGIASHKASATWPMRGVIIRRNTVRNSGSTNIYLSQTADSTVEDNLASGSLGSHGIYLANGGSDNVVLRGNRCFGNAKNGIHFNGDMSMGGDGLHRGLTIENNILYGNAANGLDMDGVQDSLIRNNLIYGNGRHALRAFRIDAAAGPKNLGIVNNTLLAGRDGGWAVKTSQDLGGHAIFNNILLSDNDAAGSISVPGTGFTSDNNVLVGRLSFDGKDSIASLRVWQAAGFDINSSIGAPASLFINATMDNYRLKAGAPAIDAGLASLNGIAAPATDILGNTRPQGSAHDLGAYESD